MKERFKNILRLSKKRNSIIVVIALFVIIFSIRNLIVFINSNKGHSVREVLEPYNNVTSEINDTIDTEKIERVIINNSNCVFEGNIGTQKIYMAIYREGEQLTASYITQYDDVEINLQGTIQIDTSSFILYSKDNNTTFTGMIKPETEEGELLEGTCTSLKSEAKTPFALALSHTIGNTFETRYKLTSFATEEVETFARKIKEYVIEDNKKGLAELIVYPICVIINDSKVSINSMEEFEHNYDDIMNTDFKDSISNSYTKYMNSNYMGIMLGYGAIWFDDWKDKGLRIYAINN